MGDSLIQNGDTVCLDCPDSANRTLATVGVDKNVRLWKKRVDVAALVGHAYGTMFEVVKSKLVVLEDDHELDGGGAGVSTVDSVAMSEHAHSAAKGVASEDGLSAEAVEAMRAAGVRGYDIVAEAVKANPQFAKRDVFSKEKFLKRKLKKHLRRVRAVKATARIVLLSEFERHPAKLNMVRPDSFARAQHFVSVRAGATIGVVDGSPGLFTGAIAERMGGLGTLYTFHSLFIPTLTHSHMFNLPEHRTVKDMLVSVQIQNLLGMPHATTTLPDGRLFFKASPEESAAGAGAGDTAPAEEPAAGAGGHDTAPPPAKRSRHSAEFGGGRTEARTAKATAKLEAMAHKLATLRATGLDGLIVASAWDPAVVTALLVRYVKPGSPFAVLSVNLEHLLHTWRLLRAHRLAYRVNITEMWSRPYQVKPGRTHPEMSMHGAPGFIMTGFAAFTEHLMLEVPLVLAADEPPATDGGSAPAAP